MPTIEDGRQAVEQGNLQQARLIFEAILQENRRSEEAWLGLAEVLTDVEDKRICYENVLKINKGNRAAKEGLRNLEPQANPLIAELQAKAAARAPDDDEDEEADDDDDRPDTIGTSESAPAPAFSDDIDSDGPPTYALVAIGLILSVVVFALGGGAVFIMLTSLAGG